MLTGLFSSTSSRDLSVKPESPKPLLDGAEGKSKDAPSAGQPVAPVGPSTASRKPLAAAAQQSAPAAEDEDDFTFDLDLNPGTWRRRLLACRLPGGMTISKLTNLTL